MIYFISDFGFFYCNEKYEKLKNNISKLKENIQKNNNNILLLGGDNFYPDGLEHEKDIKLKRFGELFNFIPKTRMYATLGNHDYSGYTNLQYNNNYFTCKHSFYILPYENIDIYMIDTTVIDYTTYTLPLDVYRNLFPEKYIILNNNSSLYIEDKNDIILNDLFMYRRIILERLDYQMRNSTSRNKKCIIVGHYPLQTYSYYNTINNKNNVFKHLLPLILKYNINCYICGHDHSNQHLNYSEKELLDIMDNQIKTQFDDYIFINQIMKYYLKIKCNTFKGLDIFICGTFVDTYKKNHISNYMSINDDNKSYLINYEPFINSYIIIEKKARYIILRYIDVNTNEEYYSVNCFI
jgi:hypothetical protein